MSKDLNSSMRHIMERSNDLVTRLEDDSYADVLNSAAIFESINDIRYEMLGFLNHYHGCNHHLYKEQNSMYMLYSVVNKLIKALSKNLPYERADYLKDNSEACINTLTYMLGKMENKELSNIFNEQHELLKNNIGFVLLIIQGYFEYMKNDIVRFKEQLEEYMEANDEIIMQSYLNFRKVNEKLIQSHNLDRMISKGIAKKDGNDPTLAQWIRLMESLKEEMYEDPLLKYILLAMKQEHKVDMSCEVIHKAVRRLVDSDEKAEHYMMRIAEFHLAWENAQPKEDETTPAQPAEVNIQDLLNKYLHPTLLKDENLLKDFMDETQKIILACKPKSILTITCLAKTYVDDGTFVEEPNQMDTARILCYLNNDPNINDETIRGRLKYTAISSKDASDKYWNLNPKNNVRKACEQIHDMYLPIIEKIRKNT